MKKIFRLTINELIKQIYKKNFVITLSILPVMVQVIIMMVNGNLGTSVAILGAFGLIRFRSMPGTAKEIVSVFFAMAIGLATGMGHVLFATYVTAIISILIGSSLCMSTVKKNGIINGACIGGIYYG
mgnify:CR=1 FL=1